MPKPSTPDIWAAGKTFSFQPSQAQQSQGFDYIASVRPGTGAPITDDHDWPLNKITTSLKWIADQIPNDGLKTAAFRDVGVGSNQIPDMSSFGSGSGWARMPNGKIMQWGYFDGSVGTIQSGVVTLPIPFVSDYAKPVLCLAGSSVSVAGAYIIFDASALTKRDFTFRMTGSQSRFSWFVIGE